MSQINTLHGGEDARGVLNTRPVKALMWAALYDRSSYSQFGLLLVKGDIYRTRRQSLKHRVQSNSQHRINVKIWKSFRGGPPPFLQNPKSWFCPRCGVLLVYTEPLKCQLTNFLNKSLEPFLATTGLRNTYKEMLLLVVNITQNHNAFRLIYETYILNLPRPAGNYQILIKCC